MIDPRSLVISGDLPRTLWVVPNIPKLLAFVMERINLDWNFKKLYSMAWLLVMGRVPYCRRRRRDRVRREGIFARST
jgi:hypothetical protein